MKKNFVKTVSIYFLLLLSNSCTINEKTDFPQLTTAAISAITASSASLNVTITNGGSSNITAKGICWSTSPNPTTSLNTKTNDGTGTSSFNSLLSGLIPGTTYYVRAYATNNSGTVYSIEITFTTTAVNLKTGLVAYYPFSGNANDTSGNGNNGIVNGATLTADRLGVTNNAYYFSSSNCSTRINASINTSSIQTGLTIAIWVLKVGEGCIAPRILEFYPSSNSDGPGMAQWGWDPYNKITIGSITSTGFVSSYSFTGVTNVWTNLIYTNDGSTGKFYKNGILISSIPSSGNPILAGNTSFGRMNHPAYDSFNGKIDDIGIWNRALSQDEITALYNGQKP